VAVELDVLRVQRVTGLGPSTFTCGMRVPVISILSTCSAAAVLQAARPERSVRVVRPERSVRAARPERSAQELLRVSDLRSYHRERDFRRDNGRFLRKNCPRAFVVAHYGFSQVIWPMAVT